MQSLNWYLRRLSTMPPGEVFWRVRSEVRDLLDQYRFSAGLYPNAPIVVDADSDLSVPPLFSVSDVPVGHWASSSASTEERGWCSRLVSIADRICQHKFSFFDLEDKDLGNPIDWNRDHSAGKSAPMRFSASIDYRDFEITGDCKLVWEPNRHHQLVVLGRAYRATGNTVYAKEVVNQLASWIEACPFGKGMNWRSPLELGIRLINWVWAIDLIRDSRYFSGAFRESVLNSVYLHLWEITRKFSQGSSANNHLIGEAAGVYVAASYFYELADTAAWRAHAKEILCREIVSQSYDDGCTRELAFGYQLFVLQFFIASGLVGRWSGDDFPKGFWSRIEKQLEFVNALTEGGAAPKFGDCDDGYVLDLGDVKGDSRPLLCVGALLFDRIDFKLTSGGYAETARWLLGNCSRDRFSNLTAKREFVQLESHAFAESGHYLLQSGAKGMQDNISVVFDCGELGYGPIAAHGHADALSFVLRVGGVEIIVDPGTYDYFTYPQWRNYFRSTPAHNTVSIDDMDQSVMHGPFMWGKRAVASCLKWQHEFGHTIIAGEHDGYTRLSDPVIHRRTMDLNSTINRLSIIDELFAKSLHKVSINFHLSPDCDVLGLTAHTIEIRCGQTAVRMIGDDRLSFRPVRAELEPIRGWVSNNYHRKLPATTIICEGVFEGNASFSTEIVLPAQARDLSAPGVQREVGKV